MRQESLPKGHCVSDQLQAHGICICLLSRQDATAPGVTVRACTIQTLILFNAENYLVSFYQFTVPWSYILKLPSCMEKYGHHVPANKRKKIWESLQENLGIATCCVYLWVLVIILDDANGLARNQAFSLANKLALFCISMTHVQPGWFGCEWCYFESAEVQNRGGHGNWQHPMGEKDTGVADWLTRVSDPLTSLCLVN